MADILRSGIFNILIGDNGMSRFFTFPIVAGRISKTSKQFNRVAVIQNSLNGSGREKSPYPVGMIDTGNIFFLQILIRNRVDMNRRCRFFRIQIMQILGKRIISVSAKERTGMDELEAAIREMFLHGQVSFDDEIFITNVRHKAALQAALDSLRLVVQSIEDGMPEDFYSIDLMNAYEELGSIIGEAVEDDLVNEIFSKFCMGK